MGDNVRCNEENINSNYLDFKLSTELARTSLGVISRSHSRVAKMLNHQHKMENAS